MYGLEARSNPHSTSRGGERGWTLRVDNHAGWLGPFFSSRETDPAVCILMYTAVYSGLSKNIIRVCQRFKIQPLFVLLAVGAAVKVLRSTSCKLHQQSSAEVVKHMISYDTEYGIVRGTKYMAISNNTVLY